MQDKDFLLTQSGRFTIAGGPEGAEGLVLGRLVGKIGTGTIAHVALDDARMASLAESLAFFAPEARVVMLPAWDCLPYDRASPHRDILSQRIEALTLLAAPVAAAPRIVLTTVNAIIQRVPPRAAFRDRVMALRKGQAIVPDSVTAFLGRNGYARVETVAEAGEYAVRGGIIDLFPPGSDDPIRLDFFGDEVESIRRFDPLSQRSRETLDAFELKPVGEVLLDPASIERFRTGYRERFGAIAGEDPLYEAVSAGRLYPGMEHWLPLFHDRLETIFDYLPDALVTLDAQADSARLARLDTIADYYRARLELKRAEARSGSVYKPLPPEDLTILDPEWQRLLARRAVGTFSGFAAPEAGGGTPVWDAGARATIDFAEARAQPDVNLFDAVRQRLESQMNAGTRVLVAAYSPGSADRLGHLLGEHGMTRHVRAASWQEAAAAPSGAVVIVVLPIERGFGAPGLAITTEQDILGDRLARPVRRKRASERFLNEIASLGEGDLVVHAEHGIGRYGGLIALDVGGAPHDCLSVSYAGGDKLYVPVENAEVLSRYGSDEAGVELDRLGGAGWQARKARIKERIRVIASHLMRIAAERELKPGQLMTPPEGLYDEFCARFPYPETEDQLRAIEETLGDLASGKPMDRLICGDVGFGKTEVALRAAFVAVMAGFQVAVVTPTTLLCRQHFKTFATRFAGMPVKLAQVSRLVGPKETAQVKQRLADGEIDIIVGTHALLGKTVAFKRLGLIVVDEEQHFGVAQKERLKHLKTDVHVLTLTATPIPRTLQLALSGVREMSLISTPPVDRLAVRTFVLPYDPVVVREAIMREHYRGGQVFYVCPRIEDLPRLAERLKELVPEVRIVVAHGRMTPAALEAAMTAFYDGSYELLLSTSIVESGLDIPTANTIVIHRADMFGLAQLYQLRGRIGRAKIRGYAYLTLPAGRVLNPTAAKRLEVMQALDTLGAGFTLASHDLDIRGAGNLLGDEQSGHIREVGIELYQQMLEDAVNDARGDMASATAEQWTPQIAVGTTVLIPESYVADLGLRLGLYRRIATLVDRAEIDAFAAELIDRFGALPPEVENLLQVVAIKQLCREAGIERVEAGPKGVVLAFRNNSFAKPENLIRFIGEQKGAVNLRPDHRLVLRRAWENPEARIVGVHQLMRQLASLAA